MPGIFDTEGLIGAVAINGEATEASMPTFTKGITTPPGPDPVADTITFMLSLPRDVCPNEVIGRPTGQLGP